jgi:hypothetical protein
MSQRSFESDFEESNKPVLDQQPLQRTRKHMPVVEPVIESDLELEDLEIEPSKHYHSTSYRTKQEN